METKITPEQLAPRPRKGLIRAIYDVVQAIGPCGEQQVAEYLPLVLADQPPKTVPRKKIEHILYNAVYNGYLVYLDRHEGNRLRREYRIAPIEYYRQRTKIREERLSRAAMPAFGNLTVAELAERADGAMAAIVWLLISAGTFGLGVIVGHYFT